MQNKKFWNPAIIITATTVYAYSAAVLMQLGQNFYFNTHQSLIEVSIRENIFLLFILLKSAPLNFLLPSPLSLFRLVNDVLDIWQWMYLIITVLGAVSLSWFYDKLGLRPFFNRALLIIVSLIFINFIVASLQVWYDVGYNIESNKTTHLVLSSGCDFTSEDKEYIATSLYDGKAVLVPVDKVTNKMEEKFFIKDLTSLTCGLEYKEIGKVQR